MTKTILMYTFCYLSYFAYRLGLIKSPEHAAEIWQYFEENLRNGPN